MKPTLILLTLCGLAAGPEGAPAMDSEPPRLTCTRRVERGRLAIEWRVDNPRARPIYVFEAPALGPAYVLAADGRAEIARRYIPVEGLGVIEKRAPPVRKVEAGGSWVDRFTLELPLAARDPNADGASPALAPEGAVCSAGWFGAEDEVAIERRGAALVPSAHHLEAAQKRVDSPLEPAS